MAERHKLPFATNVYQYSCGNYYGNLTFIWRLPDPCERCDDSQMQAVMDVKDMIPVFSTCACGWIL